MFVLLEHRIHGTIHWDLMIEIGPDAPLVTWRLEHNPIRSASTPTDRIADHRRAYLDYEGSISGDRGEVFRLDRGQCEIIERTEAAWVLETSGATLRGRIRISPPHGRGTLERPQS